MCMLVGLGVGTVVAQRPWEARLLDTSVQQGEAARGTWRGDGSDTIDFRDAETCATEEDEARLGKTEPR